MLRLMPRERSRSEGASAPVRTLRRCASLELRLCCVPACRRYAKEADVCLLHSRERTTLRLALQPVRETTHSATIAITTPYAQRDAFSWAEPSMHPTRAKDTPRQLDDTAPNRNARCRVASCTSYARNGGCCTRHGGGRKCLMEHCTTPSQTGGLCRLHGGGTRCKLEGCTKFARVRGLCSVHFRFDDVEGHVKRKAAARRTTSP